MLVNKLKEINKQKLVKFDGINTMFNAGIITTEQKEECIKAIEDTSEKDVALLKDECVKSEIDYQEVLNAVDNPELLKINPALNKLESSSTSEKVDEVAEKVSGDANKNDNTNNTDNSTNNENN